MKIVDQRNFKYIFFIFLLSILSHVFAAQSTVQLAAQPTTCIVGKFSSVVTSGWASESLTLTNQCTSPANFQNSVITFTNKTALNTNFWGSFSPLNYPVSSSLFITSQPLASGEYTASINLVFPTNYGTTILPIGSSFTIQYGESAVGYDASSLQVWLASPISTGEIDLSNQTAKPTNVTASSATIDVISNGQTTKVQVPWQGQLQMTNLGVGTYTIQPENVTDTLGNIFQGTAVPSNLTLNANQKLTSTITYNPITVLGSVKIQTPTIPTSISGYTSNPTITLTQSDTGGTVTQSLAWNTVNTVTQLANNVSYTLSTPVISYNGNNCSATFSPNTLISSASTPPTSVLSYTCVPMTQDKITFNLSGLPITVNSIVVTLIPNDGSAQLNQTININNGTGTAMINLSDGVSYVVSTNAVTGYTATFSPQPLIAKASGTETITWQANPTGKVITYIPGWKATPSPGSLSAAGYTHAIIAFGVFSMTTPGQIVSAFDMVTADYIHKLHDAGIKVSLSLGGASTSIANTTVVFHDVLAAASSPTVFEQTFIQSINNLITQYGFDGIDIDIEQGLTAGGTFTNPTGDIAVMAAIINQLHTNNPSLLISLVPQIDNIAATSGFSEPWGNYASLIMQTHNALSWVGIQMYNSGCAFGIDDVCYDPNNNTSPNASVAMATDLLANWPATSPSGQATGFQPYISYLSPSQVVLGYAAANSSGATDGNSSPAANITTIKRSIQCLRTAVAGSKSCDTYVPPAAYLNFGGVFDWEVTYDQDNNFAFATGLSACVQQNNCQ